MAYLARQETKLTQEGAISGTTAYLSPEAWRDEPLDVRSDIWSFGAMLYEMPASLCCRACRRHYDGRSERPAPRPFSISS